MRSTEDLKRVIAQNIVELRTKEKMTQLDLAERLNYTDKAISKWERAESIPDIVTLKATADLFGVSVDYLLTTDHSAATVEIPDPAGAADTRVRRRHTVITVLSILLVWLIGSAAFVFFSMEVPGAQNAWLSFLHALPVSMIVWLVLNSIWFDRRRNYLIISLLMWSLLAAIHVTFVMAGRQVWMIYILGAPGQLIILAWSRLIVRKRRE